MNLHDDNDTTVSESISYDTLSLASDVQSLNSIESSPLHMSNHEPSNLAVNWEELGEILRVDKSPHTDNSSEYSRENSVYHSITESSLSCCDTNMKDELKSQTEESLSISLYEDYITPQNTLRSAGFENFQDDVEKEYIYQANLMSNIQNGTLKANQPIDPNRINDSLKLYGDGAMTKSISEAKPIQVLALPKANLITGMLDACKINDTFDRFKSSIDYENDLNVLSFHKKDNLEALTNLMQKHDKHSNNDTDTSTTITPDDDIRNTNYEFDSNDESETETLKAHLHSAANGIMTEYSNTSNKTNSETSLIELRYTKGWVNEDGVMLRKPPKNGSTAIKRRSGNRRSRMKLKRRCSINGHFYNRETSFFTPPRGSQMNVWVTSLTNTKEVMKKNCLNKQNHTFLYFRLLFYYLKNTKLKARQKILLYLSSKTMVNSDD